MMPQQKFREFATTEFATLLSSLLTIPCPFPLHSDSATLGLLKTGPTYPFGVDPAWKGSRTELPFLNSLKMKMSIVFGVSQMFLGIFLKYMNDKFFNQPLNIW